MRSRKMFYLRGKYLVKYMGSFFVADIFFGHSHPGSVTIAPASYVCAVGSVERILTSLGSDFERVGTVPPAFILVKQRIVARAGDNGALLTPLEQELAADVTAINVASASPSFRDIMAASTRGRRRQRPDANATCLGKMYRPPADGGGTTGPGCVCG